MCQQKGLKKKEKGSSVVVVYIPNIYLYTILGDDILKDARSGTPM